MPQPIDPTTEIARTAAIERIQQFQTRADLTAQARLAAEAARHQVEAESQVDQPHAKSDEVDRELRRRNPYSGRRKKRQPAAAPPPTEETLQTYDAHERPARLDPEEPHGLDIKV